MKRYLKATFIFLLIFLTKLSSTAKAERKVELQRLYGKDRFETSKIIADKVKELGGSKTKYTLANGLIFADALSGGAYSAKYKLPLILTDGINVPSEYKNKSAIVFGGQSAVNLENINISQRFAGNDRFETAKAIAYGGFSNSKSLIFTSGFKFPDALSAINISLKTNSPILFSENSLNNELLRAPINIINDIGELGSVLHSQVNISNAKIESITGKDRYQTSLLVAKKVNPNPKAVIVVNGLEFADALSASSLIGVLDDTTIILTDPKTLSKEAEEYLMNDSVEKVYILGGNNAVSKTVENQILQKKPEVNEKALTPEKEVVKEEAIVPETFDPVKPLNVGTSESIINQQNEMNMPKLSVKIKGEVFPIVNIPIKNIGELTEKVQKRLDLRLKEWVNNSTYFVKEKRHKDNQSIWLVAHLTPYGKLIINEKYIYFSDSDGVVKKYVLSHKLENLIGGELFSDEEMDFLMGEGGDYIGFDTCTGKYTKNGAPISTMYVFKLAE